jgi:hypothetical protein
MLPFMFVIVLMTSTLQENENLIGGFGNIMMEAF